MRSSYYLRNNVSLAIGIIHSVLKAGRTITMAELALLLPFLLDDRIVSILLDSDRHFTMNSLITMNNIALANFNDRYFSLLPLVYQSMSILLDVDAISVSDGVIRQKKMEPFDAMVEESGSRELSNICKASERLFALVARENTYELYRTLRVEL
mgnify:CR=1 FL=1